MAMHRVLVFIVSYNAEAHIENVLNRIPALFWQRDLGHEVLIIDDASADTTVARARAWATAKNKPLTVFCNPKNQGYGGNQKVGYAYAMEKNFSAVVLLHGDGQYAPELLSDMVAPILAQDADVVLGSRMLRPKDALKGGMPIYKWIGNRIITAFQNRLLGTSLSEFHTGYRAWSVAALRRIPFLRNSPDFDFDTEILIQSADRGLCIKEIPIPTHYGDEICHVNGPKYALQVLYATSISRAQSFGIFYTPKYDYLVYGDNTHYLPKLAFDSSHTYGVAACKPGDTILDIGCGNGTLLPSFNRKNVRVFGIDSYIDDEKVSGFDGVIRQDIESLSPQEIFPGQSFDAVLMLDIIEHFKNPEQCLDMLRERFGMDGTRFIITTPNIAFIIMRLSLLFGQFNYGKRGILDFTHRRLFTFKTLKRILRHHGYNIERIEGIPVPFELQLGDTTLSRWLTRLNNFLICISKTLFSFQIYVECRPTPTAYHLLEMSARHGEKKVPLQ